MNNKSVYDKMTNYEKEVAGLLKDSGIKWSYEHPVFVWDENKRPRVWTPDFYLISFGIYVEVCGSANFDYEYRKNIYNINGHSVIFLQLYKESEKWKKHFFRFLQLFTLNRSNRLNKIIDNK